MAISSGICKLPLELRQNILHEVVTPDGSDKNSGISSLPPISTPISKESAAKEAARARTRFSLVCKDFQKIAAQYPNKGIELEHTGVAISQFARSENIDDFKTALNELLKQNIYVKCDISTFTENQIGVVVEELQQRANLEEHPLKMLVLQVDVDKQPQSVLKLVDKAISKMSGKIKDIEFGCYSNDKSRKRLEEVYQLRNLTDLHVVCPALVDPPRVTRSPKLTRLVLTGTSIRRSPDISRNALLKVLDLSKNRNLNELPNLSSNLELTSLIATNNRGLQSLPDVSKNIKLEVIDVTDCKKLPEFLETLSQNANVKLIREGLNNS